MLAMRVRRALLLVLRLSEPVLIFSGRTDNEVQKLMLEHSMSSLISVQPCRYLHNAYCGGRIRGRTAMQHANLYLISALPSTRVKSPSLLRTLDMCTLVLELPVLILAK